MTPPGIPRLGPGWERLRELAEQQDGLFTELQALECGVTPKHMLLLLRGNQVHRVRWRIYRLGGFSSTPVEPVVLAWLWSGREAIVSHATALALHGVAPLAASEVHLTLPPGHPRRHHRTPGPIRLHLEHVVEDEVVQVHGLPALCLERALAQSLRSLTRQEIRRILEEVCRMAVPQALT